MLDTIITVEMTCDQACAILASIKAAALENDEWLDNNQKHSQRDDVEEMNHILRDVARNIVNEMKQVNMKPTDEFDKDEDE